jgi:hypothetical protein
MEKNKKDEFKAILSKANEFKIDAFSTKKSFDFELIDVNNEIENSILFSSLNEAVEIMSEFTGTNRKNELINQILNFVNVEDLLINPSIRIKFNLS